MSKKTDGKPQGKEKPFYRPFEALAKEKLAALQKQQQQEAKPTSKPGKGGKAPAAGSSGGPAPSGGGGSGGAPGGGPEPESFADLLYGVTPLSSKERSKPAAPQAPAADDEGDAASEAEAVRAHLAALVSGGEARFEIHDDGQRLEGRRLDVDPRTVRRLRRGELMIDLRCDLHGLTAHEARARLEDVVPRARQRGERVMLLIHGKGRNSPGGRSVLRGEMAAWLSQGPASVHVAAFTTALDEDGGEGALYVLLRR